MAFVEDLSPFFSAAEFADDALLDGVAVLGIFDRAYVAAGAGMGMSSSAPAFTLSSIDVPVSPVGLLLVHDGVNYGVAACEPDGTGVSILILELTA